MMFIRRSFKGGLTDEELAKKYLKSGDLEVLSTVYNRYLHLVYGVCLKYLKNEEDAKDEVMSIYEKLIVDLRKHKVEHFQSWLYVKVKNHCLMILRKRQAESKKELKINNDFVEISDSGHLNNKMILEEHLSIMEACMEKLPDNQKECIELFFLKEKCYKEIADIAGYDLKKVKSYIQNGKRNLKNCMEKQVEVH